jgi:hypothetical protein
MPQCDLSQQTGRTPIIRIKTNFGLKGFSATEKLPDTDIPSVIYQAIGLGTMEADKIAVFLGLISSVFGGKDILLALYRSNIP